MTGMCNYLVNIEPVDNEFVTFGDGVRSRVIGKGTLDLTGFPKLDGVLLVENLKVNLISISHLCDENLHVKFTKDQCRVYDEKEKCVLTGNRSDNFLYMLEHGHMCHFTTMSDTEIWHHKLGHINYKHLMTLASSGSVRGIPKLMTKVVEVCPPCQFGKQKCESHSLKQAIRTGQIMELLHMDLMGPMQIESVGGKKYIFVCVDDFSRYTWIDLIREKSDTFNVFEKLCLRLQNEKRCNIIRIRSDHCKEFQNSQFVTLCQSYGIQHEFSAPKTPQ